MVGTLMDTPRKALRYRQSKLSVRARSSAISKSWSRSAAAAPNNSPMTVSDSGTFEIYALDWDAR